MMVVYFTTQDDDTIKWVCEDMEGAQLCVEDFRSMYGEEKALEIIEG